MSAEDHGRGLGGTPSIFLHGLYGSKQSVRQASRTLAERCRHGRSVLACDLRNHGDSPWSEAMDFGLMAQDVLHMADIQGYDRFTVVGHSLGGKVALATALAAPDRIAGVAAVDVAPVSYGWKLPHYEYARHLKALDINGPIAQKKGRGGIDQMLASAIPEKITRAFLLTNLLRDDNGVFRWRLNLDDIEKSMPKLLGFDPLDGKQPKPYQGHTLFLAAEVTGYVTEEHEPVIRRYFPNSEIRRLGKSHWVHAVHLDLFTEEICAFLFKLKT